MTGQDTVQIAGRVLKDFGDGDVFVGTYPNDLAAVKTGKDGNSIFAANATGQLVEAVLRVLRGSSDDTFLNDLLIAQEKDIASFPLIEGYMTKRVGDGQGNVKNDTYFLTGGLFTKKVPFSSNVEGNTEQAIAVYTFKFAKSDRGTQ